jgi:nucleotide-binding universal stress UspA family protein
MPGEILVPVGGNAEAVVALPTALALAQALDAGVHLSYVVQVPSGPLAGAASALGAGRATAAVRARIDRALAQVAEEISAAGLRGTCSVLEGGDVAGLLIDQARVRGARMIVMAARPRTAIERALSGSVADRLVRDPEVPVVVVPVRNDAEQGALVHATEFGAGLVGAALRVARPVRRILVPMDDSPHALRALSTLGPVARSADEVTLLHVVVPEALIDIVHARGADDGRPLHNHLRATSDRFERIAEQLRVGFPTLRAVVIQRDDPAVAIIVAARDREADLIAMSSRGEGGIKRAVTGSTASDVLRSVAIPTLVVASSAAQYGGVGHGQQTKWR